MAELSFEETTSIFTLPAMKENLDGRIYDLGYEVKLQPLGRIINKFLLNNVTDLRKHSISTYALSTTTINFSALSRAMLSIQVAKPVNTNGSKWLIFNPVKESVTVTAYNICKIKCKDAILEVKDARAAAGILSKMCSLSNPSRLLIAQESFSVTHSTFFPSMQILTLFAALEALFGEGQNEIAHQIAERCAIFLEKKPADRNERYITVKKLYNIRSKIIHGDEPKYSGSLFEGLKDDSDKLERAIEYTREAIRLCLLRIMQSDQLFMLFTDKKREKISEHFQEILFGHVNPEA